MKRVYFVLEAGSDGGPVGETVFLKEEDALAYLYSRINEGEDGSRLFIDYCALDEGNE